MESLRPRPHRHHRRLLLRSRSSLPSPPSAPSPPASFLASNGKSLYVAIAILGATVMPHNLYLHSALVQTRRIGTSLEDRRTACRYQFPRFLRRPERRSARQRRHPHPRRRRVLHARHRRHRDPAGPYAARPSARHHLRQRALRRRPAVLRPILHSHRNHGRPDRDGRLPQLSHAPLAAPPGHPRHGHRSRRPRRLFRRRHRSLPPHHPQPS